MKIAKSPLRLLSYTALGIVSVLGSGVSLQAFAADAALPTLTAPAPAVASAPAAAPAAFPSEQTVGFPGVSGAAANKSLAPLEDKVTDSVRNVVKQFGTTDGVNLDDLNTAHQAIAKLDVLIEIEKKMAELNKIKNGDKGTGSTGGLPGFNSNTLASAIPATALSPLPVQDMEQAPVVHHHESLTRIEGANGHYAAVIDNKTYYIGDKLPNGGTVIAISTQTVDIKSKDGEHHELKVKGVQQVYGHNL